jgi:P-type Cu+ transporter
MRLYAILASVAALAAVALNYFPVPYQLYIVSALTAIAVLCSVQSWRTSWPALCGVLLLLTYGAFQAVSGYYFFLALSAVCAAIVCWRALPKPLLTEQTIRWHDTLTTLPVTVKRISRGVHKDVAVADVEVGHMLFVGPGETFALDGIIVEGTTSTDESVLTGTAALIDKLSGSKVYAGTINVSGKIVMRVTALPQHSVVYTLHGHAKEVSLPQAPLVELTETKAKKFGTTFVIAALIGGAVWAFFGVEAGILHGAAALLILYPVALQAGARKHYQELITNYTQEGVLIRDATTVEKLATLNTVVFDKTGILTKGDLQVENVVSYKPYTQQQVLNLAATVASQNNHVVSRTILYFARSLGAMSLQKVEDFTEYGAKGMSGIVNGKKVLVGTAALIEHHTFTVPVDSIKLKEEGKTVVYVAVDKDLIGYVALHDSLRDNAKDVIHMLKPHYRTVLVSGDDEDTAVAFARSAGMHEIIPADTQQERADEIKRLQDKEKIVAFVSTGMHDEIVRKQANASLAIGAQHVTDITSHDAVLLRPDLALIPKLLLSCKEFVRAVHHRAKASYWYHVVVLIAVLLIPSLPVLPLVAALMSTAFSYIAKV